MNESVNKYPYWKTFRLTDGKTRHFYTDTTSVSEITDKKWFNKSTMKILIHKGYETEEYGTEPISETIYYITIEYRISNYFGDTSGMHFRNKNYVLVDGIFYKQEKGEGIKVMKITKELKGSLVYITERLIE